MLLTMHHIISDGWSRKVFFQELAALYQAFCNGSPSPLPQLPIQYADFALWQRQWLEGEGLSTQLAYWKQQLDAAPSAGIAHRLSATCCSNFPWRERNPDTPPTPDGRAEVLEPTGRGNLVHAVAGSVQDAALPLYRAG